MKVSTLERRLAQLDASEDSNASFIVAVPGTATASIYVPNLQYVNLLHPSEVSEGVPVPALPEE